MAKPLLIVPVSGCIRYKGVDYLPDDAPFACDAAEAKRLIDMEVAAIAIKAAPPQESGKTKEQEAQETAAAAKVELIAAIASASTVEELQALLPEEEPEADLQEAFSARLAELEKGE